MQRAGWIITGIVVLFLLVASAAPKFAGAEAAVKAMADIGWPTGYLLFLGVLEVVLAILFALPRTGPLGAVLLTGLLGGTIASHLRAGSPMFSHTLFGLYLAAFIWLALYLRDPKFRAFAGRYLTGR